MNVTGINKSGSYDLELAQINQEGSSQKVLSPEDIEKADFSKMLQQKLKQAAGSNDSELESENGFNRRQFSVPPKSPVPTTPVPLKSLFHLRPITPLVIQDKNS